MAAYREPGFEERAALAARAKSAALARLRARPPIDEAERAARAARALQRETAAEEKRAAKRMTREAAAALKRIATAEISAVEDTQANATGTTEADRKAARDARYAARKGRKSK
ncbi:hypothetical protein DAH66_04060 [Sphingomonas koreensis]|uniref:Uncharacterized protein n=1 Tax=Sphingomonas koreensis TaxID=93064 RepID=A0A430G6Y0_9SPHN|nr:DUF6481 family protein [Sphingomonas koreensis]RSY88640.1 hypothetical protein DAH66_04060 [Sphingomonas koreensis]